MAAHDASLMSEIEDWAIAAIVALRISEQVVFEAEQVIHYPGLAAWDASYGDYMSVFVNAARRPFASVAWQSSTAMQHPAEDSRDRESTFMLHLVTDNVRGIDLGDAPARTGETGTPVTPGTNLLTELITDALHDKAPAKTSGSLSWTTDRTQVRSTRLIPAPKGISVVEIELVVREVPSA